MESGWKDEDDVEDGLRNLFPPDGWLICRHFRMDLWLIGVVREQPESSSKAESTPSSDFVEFADSETKRIF